MRTPRTGRIVATTRYRDHNGQATESEVPDLTFISGMAPECKLLSLKVLDGAGDDHVGSVKGAIQARCASSVSTAMDDGSWCTG